MKIRVSCPGCKKSSQIDSAHAQKRLRCPRCGQIFHPQSHPDRQASAPPAATSEPIEAIPVAEAIVVPPATDPGNPSQPQGYWSTEAARAAPPQLSRAEPFALASHPQKRTQWQGLDTEAPVSENFVKGMFNIGSSLLAIGIMVCLLPLFGLQLRRLRRFGSAGFIIGVPMIAAGGVLMFGAKSRNPRMFAVIGALTGGVLLMFMIGGKMIADAVSEPSVASQIERERSRTSPHAPVHQNNRERSARSTGPFEPDLSQPWSSTYSTIHWDEGWYGTPRHTLKITSQGWDKELGMYVVQGTWGRTYSDSYKGGFRFEFDTEQSFSGHWWRDGSANRRNRWTGYCD